MDCVEILSVVPSAGGPYVVGVLPCSQSAGFLGAVFDGLKLNLTELRKAVRSRLCKIHSNVGGGYSNRETIMLQQLSDSLRVDPSCICARRPTASRIAKKARSKMAATYQAAIDCEPSQSSMLPLLEVQELSGGVPRRVRAGVPTSFSNELFDGKILLLSLIHI